MVDDDDGASYEYNKEVHNDESRISKCMRQQDNDTLNHTSTVGPFVSSSAKGSLCTSVSQPSLPPTRLEQRLPIHNFDDNTRMTLGGGSSGHDEDAGSRPVIIRPLIDPLLLPITVQHDDVIDTVPGTTVTSAAPTSVGARVEMRKKRRTVIPTVDESSSTLTVNPTFRRSLGNGDGYASSDSRGESRVELDQNRSIGRDSIEVATTLTKPFSSTRSSTSKLGRLRSKFDTIPSRYKMMCLILWLSWKLISTIAILYFVGNSFHHSTGAGIGTASSFNTTDPSTMFFGKVYKSEQYMLHALLMQKEKQEVVTAGASASSVAQTPPPTKILYMITSGQRRDFSQVLQFVKNNIIPNILNTTNEDVVVEKKSPFSSSHNIMDRRSYHLDVYLILGYPLSETAGDNSTALLREFQTTISSTVGIEVWDDAVPVGYVDDGNMRVISNLTTALGRQHRYVVKDKLLLYDLFCSLQYDNFMDIDEGPVSLPMITGDHLEYYLQVSNHLEELKMQMFRDAVLVEMDRRRNTTVHHDVRDEKIENPLDFNFIDHILPGFLLLQEQTPHEVRSGSQIQNRIDPYRVTAMNKSAFPYGNAAFDPKYCCENIVAKKETDLAKGNGTHETQYGVLAETLLVHGVSATGFHQKQLLIPSRLSGTATNNSDRRSTQSSSLLVSGSEQFLDWVAVDQKQVDILGRTKKDGWWTATPRQILQLNRLCDGGFLPSFDPPAYHSDGLVWSWSSFQNAGMAAYFTGRNGTSRPCNLQQFISLNPDHISKHFVLLADGTSNGRNDVLGSLPGQHVQKEVEGVILDQFLKLMYTRNID